ncbi:protein MRG2-like isoform X1 [Glycine soja]|uniref:protein MRG2-like isoform X1 n=1 Tax=Glycine soja TaxID=3848 RepID=UPI00103FAD22|nr:protein MRG2-like isoform X1 [Glycine soja]
MEMGISKTTTSTEVTDDNSNSSSTTHTQTRNHISFAAPYAVGEKVLTNHSDCLYEAKVRQVEYRNTKGWQFLVHYLGWKKRWDEWLDLDRLMKHTEENMRKKHDLDEKLGNDKNAKVPRGSLAKSKPTNVSRGRKRRNESVIKGKPAVDPDKLVNIQIPPTLKKQLVDDCEFITHLGKLVKLPRTPNVKGILKNYFDYRLKKCGSVGDSVEEIMKGLSCYFDKALPVMLLYKNERQQYQEACPANVFPSAIYGAEHLLRLFVKLPELLFHASVEEETLMELQAHLIDFLRFQCFPPGSCKKTRAHSSFLLIMLQKVLRTAPTNKCVCLVKPAYVYVWTQPVHVEEHKNQLHMLLRAANFFPSQIDVIPGVLLLVSLVTITFPGYL